MDIELLFGSPVSVIVLMFSLLLIVGALFSKRIRRYSEKIEIKKMDRHPSYARQKDILSAYCPNCETKLDSIGAKSRKCQTCGKCLELNPTFVICTSIGFISIFTIPVAGTFAFFAAHDTMLTALYIVALALILYGLCRPWYRCLD